MAAICLFFLHNRINAAAVLVGTTLDEQVVMVPANPGVQLETTIFKPPGDGPFPLLIMNHGKALGDPHSQQRDRFVVISREFVKHGYAVVIPMRKGFAKSTGTYIEAACDMTANGKTQADDLQAALRYIVAQRWADKNHIVIAGQSYGGLTAMAFGARDFPGVRGLINFAGGLRIHGSGCAWQSSLVEAFAEFGKHTTVPSLWFYGANDSLFSPELAAKLYSAYVAGGGKAKLVAYDTFRNDAHGMSSSWEGLKIWWPKTEEFLKKLGMPTEQVLTFSDESRLPKTGYAALDNVDAVPYLEEKGRDAYRTFLGKSFPRAFAVSSNGAWSWAEDVDDPAAQVLTECEKHSAQACRLYAVDNDVVWSDLRPAAAVHDAKQAGTPAVSTSASSTVGPAHVTGTGNT